MTSLNDIIGFIVLKLTYAVLKDRYVNTVH